jgi:hypothetical protein
VNIWYVVAAIVALVGVVFLGQGLGVIPGSAMTGSSFWAVVGAALLIGAGLLVWWMRRSPIR